jgi:multiple sugar transport system substrate-binding protein
MSKWSRPLALIAALWLLVACVPAAAPQTGGEAAPAAASAEDVVEVEFWYIPFTLEEEGHAAQIAEFEAANPNIKIKVVQVPYEEITQKVAASVPVGEGPDVIVPYYGWVPLWRQNGFLAPLPG